MVWPAAGEELHPILDRDPEPLLLLEHQDELERAHRVLVDRNISHGVDVAVLLCLASCRSRVSSASSRRG